MHVADASIHHARSACSSPIGNLLGAHPTPSDDFLARAFSPHPLPKATASQQVPAACVWATGAVMEAIA